MTQTATAAPATETRLDRIGIPNSIKWGFLAVLIFMTGNGVESNFISPHLTLAVGDENLAATIISVYGISVLVGSYLSGAMSDLLGPKRVMLIGFLVWIVFEAAFLLAIQMDSPVLITLSYFFRGFGFPLFAFSFLVWINHVAPRERNATAVGWFYVMFTGGMPTLGSLVAILAIPSFGGGAVGETGAMIVSSLLILTGFLLVWFGVREPRGLKRLAPPEESAATVILGGLRVMVLEPRIFAGFCVRLINTAPQFGMFVILPAVMVNDLGWSQSQWLLMTTIVFAGNISFNALFGYIGDQWGWIRTVRWFGIVGSALGLLAWWYVPHMVEPGSTWGYWLTVIAGTTFGILLAGFVPMGAVMPNLTPDHKGAAMAMYTTAAGGAVFLGSVVVAIVRPWAGDVGVVWAFVLLYGVAFALTHVLKVPQVRGESH